MASWSTVLLSSLAILNTISPVSADSGDTYVIGKDSAGAKVELLSSRTPALFTGNFGDCMGGQSLINVTTFDAAYYADNMTVLFHLAGNTNLQNESVMIHIGVQAYGEDRFDLTFNPCSANFASLCPMNSSKPISGEAIIPVSASEVSGIPAIALVIPDFEGSATLRVFSNSTQTEIACFQAVMRNGASFSHPAAVSSVLGIFTAIAVFSSFATAIYGVSIPHIRTHYAHSLSVLVVFEVFQSIFLSGALSVAWPSVLPAFWSNFAWSAGLIYTPSIIKSVNSFTGISGNSSQVGGAGSSTINNNGGLQQQIYGRSLKKLQEYSHSSKMARGNEMVKRMGTLAKRATSDNATKGFLWYLILIVILVASAVAFKFILEAFSKMKWIKEDRLALFRNNWIKISGLIVLRSMLIAFFMIMTLSLYQFSYGGTTGIIAIAAIIFIIFFFGILALAFYACYFRLRFGNYASAPDRIHFQRKKVMKFLPWYGAVRESSMGESETAKTSGSISFFRLHYVDLDKERQSVHQDEEYTKRFGWLSARYRRTRWWFFAFWVVYQFVRACFVGGARSNPAAQVFGNLVVEVIAFIAIICLNPFEGARNTALAVYMLGISKVATAGLSVAFLPRYNVARIPTTATQSTKYSHKVFRSPGTESCRSSTSTPPVPEEPKEPYFSVTQVRRAPKIEDEDTVPEMPEMRGNRDPNPSQPSLPTASRSRATSMRSQHSGYGSVPYGARVHRASWSSREFQNWQQDEIARGDSPFNAPSRQASMHHTINNSTSTAPLVHPKVSQTSLRSNTPKREKTAQYADQRVGNAS
ncbi:trp-like ion channel [Botrytis cinerea]